MKAIQPQGVTAVLHFAGDPAELTALTAPGGRLASTIGFSQEQAGERDVKVTTVMAMPDPATLDRLANEVASGRLRVPVERSYLLSQVPQALADFANGKNGKIGITVAA